MAADEQRRRRSRQHTPDERVTARRGDAGRDRRLEHLARLARVANDQDPRALRPAVGDGGAGQRQREVRGQEVSGLATDAVRAEKLPRHTGASALGELRPLAGLLEPGLLALLDPRVAGQEAAPLELAA